MSETLLPKQNKGKSLRYTWKTHGFLSSSLDFDFSKKKSNECSGKVLAQLQFQFLLSLSLSSTGSPLVYFQFLGWSLKHLLVLSLTESLSYHATPASKTWKLSPLSLHFFGPPPSDDKTKNLRKRERKIQRHRDRYREKEIQNFSDLIFSCLPSLRMSNSHQQQSPTAPVVKNAPDDRRSETTWKRRRPQTTLLPTNPQTTLLPTTILRFLSSLLSIPSFLAFS